MKKKLVYIFVGVLALLLVIYLIRYKQALNFKDKIPKSATAVVNVNLRQLEHHILVDFLSNPFVYIRFKASKKKRKKSFIDAVSVPKNILFFTNDTGLKNTWFSTVLNIRNNTVFTERLLADNFKKTNHQHFDLYSKNNVVFAVKNKQFIVAYSYNTQKNIADNFQLIFNETVFLMESSELLQPIVQRNNDANYTSIGGDFLEATFKKGTFELNGNITSNFFITEKHREPSQNSVAHITAKINKHNDFFKSLIADEHQVKFNEFTKLSIDSITKKWTGTFDFNLKAVSSKIDTIVTYEYDDDFNKIEKIATQKLIIPELEFELASEKNTVLYNYLSQKNAIQVIEKDTIFAAIPLYKLFVQTTENSVQISDKNSEIYTPVKEHSYKVNAYFNIEKYLQNQLDFAQFPVDNKYIKLLKEASVQLSDKNELSVKIHLKNTKRNFLGQLTKQ